MSRANPRSPSHAFRRGAAYTLEMCTSIEFRTWAMGHNAGSKSYVDAYVGMTTTTNIQSIMHDATVTQDVMPESSMPLGLVRNAPKRLSTKCEDRVMAEATVQSASKLLTNALDNVTAVFPLLAVACERRIPNSLSSRKLGMHIKTLSASKGKLSTRRNTMILSQLIRSCPGSRFTKVFQAFPITRLRCIPVLQTMKSSRTM